MDYGWTCKKVNYCDKLKFNMLDASKYLTGGVLNII